MTFKGLMRVGIFVVALLVATLQVVITLGGYYALFAMARKAGGFEPHLVSYGNHGVEAFFASTAFLLVALVRVRADSSNRAVSALRRALIWLIGVASVLFALLLVLPSVDVTST